MIIRDKLFWVKFENTQYAIKAKDIKEALEIASKWRDDPILEVRASDYIVITRDLV